MRESLEELLRDLRAGAEKNRIWSEIDAALDFRLQSGATASAYGYVVGRLQEILDDNPEG